MELEFENSFDFVSLTPPSEHLRSQATPLHRLSSSCHWSHNPDRFYSPESHVINRSSQNHRKMLLRWSTWKNLAELSLSDSEHNGEVKWRWNENLLRKESERSDLRKIESKQSQ